MENKFIDNLTRSFSLELPKLNNMDKYLDFIIPKVRPWGEDLYETANYVDTRWLEIRDDDDFHESVLHIFRAEEEYLHSIDGNISRGQWRILSRSNTLILEQLIDGNVAKSELFDLAFMNRDFFILKKHGDQIRKGQKKYFVMGRESLVRGLEWRDTMELLFNRYRNNSQFIVLVVIVVILLALMIVFSIL